VIPNQIVRDTYLTTCAHRLQVSEQTLLNVMNNYIRRDIEEKEKEREREQRSQDATIPVEEETPSASLIPIGLHTVGEQVTEVERLMIQNIIRHGEEVIYENVETEEGDTVNLTLAQYVAYDLGQDGLTFHDELYNRILAECVEHCGEPGFKAATYFTQHPDIEVSQLASKMIVNRYQLGKRFENQEREGGPWTAAGDIGCAACHAGLCLGLHTCLALSQPLPAEEVSDGKESNGSGKKLPCTAPFLTDRAW
jgi:DNA primase